MTEFESSLAMAERLILTERVDEGMSLLSQLLYEEPGSAELHNELGWGYLYFMGNVSEAERHFEAAIRFDPSFAPPYLHLGNLHNQAGRYEVALSWFARGGDRANANRAALAEGMGWAHEMRGEYRRAIRRYKEALALSAGPAYEAMRQSIRRCRGKCWIFLLNAAVDNRRSA